MTDARENPADAQTKCKVLRDFEIRGVQYRTGTTITLRRLTADLLEKAGKVRLLDEVLRCMHVR